MIIVEVKSGHGGARVLAERFSSAQARRLEQVADRLHRMPLVGGRPMRIDLVLVMFDRSRRDRVRHLAGASAVNAI